MSEAIPVEMQLNDDEYAALQRDGDAAESAITEAIVFAVNVLRNSDSALLRDFISVLEARGESETAALLCDVLVRKEVEEEGIDQQTLQRTAAVLTELRMRANYTREELSELTGIPASSLAAMENPEDPILPTPREFALLLAAGVGRLEESVGKAESSLTRIEARLHHEK